MKKRFVEDVYVKVQVREPYARDTERKMVLKRSVAADAVSSIRRHVDDVYDIEIVEDIKYKCEHCRSNWTEDSDTYNGGCCDADEANNPNPEEPS